MVWSEADFGLSAMTLFLFPGTSLDRFRVPLVRSTLILSAGNDPSKHEES